MRFFRANCLPLRTLKPPAKCPRSFLARFLLNRATQARNKRTAAKLKGRPKPPAHPYPSYVHLPHTPHTRTWHASCCRGPCTYAATRPHLARFLLPPRPPPRDRRPLARFLRAPRVPVGRPSPPRVGTAIATPPPARRATIALARFLRGLAARPRRSAPEGAPRRWISCG